MARSTRMHISIPNTRARALLSRLLGAGLDAVDPIESVHRSFSREGAILCIGKRRYDLRRFQRVVVLGAGKAGAPMAQAVETVLGRRLSEGLVVVKYGHRAPTKGIDIVEAGHPVPDRAGVRAAARVLTLARGLTSRDLLIVLLSGGASSLLPVPAPGLTLRDKQQTTQLLLRSGASIQEINAVRKHLSAIKGGRLAAATSATVLCLILSDVIGDDVGSIGSGPTAPDATTFREAVTILRSYHLASQVAPRVRAHLLKGKSGGVPETPKPGAALFRRVHNCIIGNNSGAVHAIAARARRLRLQSILLTTPLTGDVRTAARLFGVMARESEHCRRPVRRPACLVAGGELTVHVTGKGLGGRAQEFALASALEIEGLEKIWVAGFGTDGTDGPTDVAGAVVDGATVQRARRRGLDVARVLAHNDSYHFFKRLGGHIDSGPTRTNVNDLYLLLAL